MLFGLTGTTLYYVLQNVGLTLTSVSSTVLILSIIPALTTILAVILLKEHYRQEPDHRHYPGDGGRSAGKHPGRAKRNVRAPAAGQPADLHQRAVVGDLHHPGAQDVQRASRHW